MALRFLNSGYFAGKVGIGTESTGAQLYVTSTNYEMLHLHQADANAGLIKFTNTDDTSGWYTGIAGTEKFIISRTADNSTPIITVEQGGNVGIGAAAPLRKLHIAGGQGFAVNASTSQYYGVYIPALGEGADPQIQIGDWHNAGATLMWDSSARSLNLDTQYSTGAGTFKITGNDGASEFFRIDSSGNVGIGVTAPDAKLHIADTNKAINTEGNLFVATTDAMAIDKGGQISLGGVWHTTPLTTEFAAIAGRKQTAANGNAGGYLQLSTSNSSGGALTEKMRVTSAGGISFGSTGTAYGTSGQVLTSAGNASPTWTTPTTGTVTGTGVTGEVAYWTSSTNIANNAGMSFSNEQLQLDGIGGADGFALPYDQNPGYSNMSAGGFGILFREARDNYITGNAYWYKTGGTASWRAKYGADAATMIGSDAGNITFETAPANTTSPHALTFSPKMVIKNGGNVGIGVTGPIEKLQVAGQLISTASNVTSAIAGTERAIMDLSNYSATDHSARFGHFRGATAAGAGQLRLYTDSVERLRIDADGNVGIGTDDPGAKLDVFSAASFRADVATGNPLISIVNNTATSNAAGTATIKFTQANTQAGGKIVSARDGNYSSGATRSSNLQFYTSSAATDSEKMRINSIGDVGINTTTPFEKLQANGNIYAENRIISADATNANENLLTQSSIKISNKNDIYGNLTKVIISPYEAAYTSDGTGSSTVRLGSETAMTPGAIHTFSVYYKDLIGSIGIDLYDVAASGSYTSAIGTAAAPVSGRLYGYAQKASTGAGAGYDFVDINLTNNGSVTLLNPKVETGKVVTEFIATTEDEGIPQTITTNNLRATGSVQMGADDTTATADKAGTMRYRTATDEAVPVTGTELITGNNGDFAGVTDGTDVTTLTMWYTYGTITSSDIESEKLELITTAANTGVRIDTPTTIGNKYQLTFTATGDLGINGIHVSSIGNASTLTSQPYVFTAIAVNTQIYFRAGDNAGGTTLYSNIQLIEVTEEDASYADMCMQTGASTYEWVNIVRNTY